MIQPAATSVASSLALTTGIQAAQGGDDAVSADFATLLDLNFATAPNASGEAAVALYQAVASAGRQTPGNLPGKKLPLALPDEDTTLPNPGDAEIKDATAFADAASTLPPFTPQIAPTGLMLPVTGPTQQAQLPAAGTPLPEQTTVDSLVRTADAPATRLRQSASVGLTRPPVRAAARADAATQQDMKLELDKPITAEPSPTEPSPSDIAATVPVVMALGMPMVEQPATDAFIAAVRPTQPAITSAVNASVIAAAVPNTLSRATQTSLPTFRGLPMPFVGNATPPSVTRAPEHEPILARIPGSDPTAGIVAIDRHPTTMTAHTSVEDDQALKAADARSSQPALPGLPHAIASQDSVAPKATTSRVIPSIEVPAAARQNMAVIALIAEPSSDTAPAAIPEIVSLALEPAILASGISHRLEAETPATPILARAAEQQVNGAAIISAQAPAAQERAQVATAGPSSTAAPVQDGKPDDTTPQTSEPRSKPIPIAAPSGPHNTVVEEAATTVGHAADAAPQEPATTAPLPTLALQNAPSASLSVTGATTTSSDAPSVGTTSRASQDLDTLVNRLAEARKAASPQPIQAVVSHSEFGQVSLRFEYDAGGLSVAMSSADPDFASAVLAGAASTQSQTASDNSSTAPREDAPRQQQNAGAFSGQSQTQSHSQAFARDHRNGQSRTMTGSGAPTGQEQQRDNTTPDNLGGIYA